MSKDQSQGSDDKLSVDDILHELIDVVSGRQARLHDERAVQMHEAITPGFTDEPLSDEEEAQLQRLQDRQDRLAKEREDRAASSPPAEAPPAPAAAEAPVVAQVPVSQDAG